MSTQETVELPEPGDLVLATVKQVTSHGAYVELGEYQGMMGFLHVSELSTGWVRHIDRYVRVNLKIVLKVIRVNTVRKEVDLSLRNVTGDERKKKIIEVKRDDKAKGIIDLVKEKLKLNDATNTKYVDQLWDHFDDLYAALEEVMKKGPKAFQKLDLPESYVTMIETVAKEKIAVRSVEVGGIVEMTCPGSDGVGVIKSALIAATDLKTGGAVVKASYLSSPTYKLSVTAENFKVAEKVLDNSLDKMKSIIYGKKGTFSFKKGSGKKVVAPPVTR